MTVTDPVGFPTEYELSLEFAGGSLDYRGRVRIGGDRLGPELELDSEGLAIESATVEGFAVPFATDAKGTSLRIRDIPAGTRAVTVAFAGKVAAEQMFGLYRSPLGAGTLFTTSLEPTGARRVFPCVDRPDAKAVFSLEIVAPSDAVPISNMPSVSTERLPDGRRRTRFVPTPPMSTYLLYLGVGPFEERQQVSRGFRLISAGAPGASERMAFVVEEAGRILEFYTDYYGLTYPLPKLHLLAIPRFYSGAMENWGAITSSEFLAFVDSRTSPEDRQRTFITLAHEIAHQWFGNLVTMRTWDDLWLNESFATLTAYLACDRLHPEWEVWPEFLYEQVSVGLMYDSLTATHPIHATVVDASQAGEMFDEISYGKGAAVLRMLEAFVTEREFREGVSQYLREHQWGSAEASDLWSAIARASHQPVDRVMSDWILRPGYPILRARLDGDSLHLDQRRFGLSGSWEEAPWPIPLSIDVEGRREHHLMTERSLRLSVPSSSMPVVGPGRVGFYRVRYEGELWERLVRSYPRLSPPDRWGLLDDARAFLLAGELELPEYLRVLDLAATDSSALVAIHVCDSLDWLAPLTLQLPDLRESFRRVLVRQTERLGFVPRQDEPYADGVARERTAIGRVCLDPAFSSVLSGKYPRVEDAAPELVPAIFMAYAANAGPAQYAELRLKMRQALPGPQARAVAGGLSCLPRDEWLLECLNMMAAGEMQPDIWSHLMMNLLRRNPSRYSALWSFFTAGWERALPFLPSCGSIAGRVMQEAIPAVGLGRPDEMRMWVAAHPLPGGAQGLQKGLELLDCLCSVLERSHAQIRVPPRTNVPRPGQSSSKRDSWFDGRES